MDAMELHALELPGHALSGARPRRDRPKAPYPAAVAQSLSALAHLVDETIEERGFGYGVRLLATRFLAIASAEVVETSVVATGVEYQYLAIALMHDIDARRPARVVGADEDDGPEYEAMDPTDPSSPRLPTQIAVAWEGDGPVGCPAVVSVRPQFGRAMVFTVWTGTDDVEVAEWYLADLMARGAGPLNPFRGHALRARFAGALGVMFSTTSVPRTERPDVVLPARLWETIDRNVHGVFAAHDRLAAAGLAVNRGVLLAGPPGTGKTAVCRVLAGEVAAHATVVFVDARALAHSVLALYREVARLAPALVVLEDIDLVVGRRELQSNPEALQDFLVALDGGLSDHAGVVTIATTNAPEAIDPAARRAARFDAVIEVPAPPAEARARIIRRYVDGLCVDAEALDVGRLVHATKGYTGAELRELFSRALIVVADAQRRGHEQALTTALVVELAAERAGATEPGQYL
jgi:hypothetical protein